MKSINQLRSLWRFIIIAIAMSISTVAYSEIIKTAKGEIAGIIHNDQRQFKGIPYAKPPVGDLRWQPPVEIDAWEGQLDASQFGNICASHTDLAGFSSTSTTEDCLYLNVYTPKKIEADQKLPVIVVIPGGGLITGSGNSYDMSKLVSRDMVVVSMNYRVGLLGYFSHPALNNEGHEAVNYGTLDQQAALRWVQDNIAHFGGDPNNVTLYGESAGGQSVLTHLVAPASKTLFHKGIVSSGAYTLEQRTLAAQTRFGLKIAQETACDFPDEAKVATCLRDLSTEDLLDERFTMMEGINVDSDTAIIDGTILPMSFKDAFSSGQYHQVPLINGFNENEGAFFVALMEMGSEKTINLATFSQGLTQFVGEPRAKKLLETHEKEAKSENLGTDFARLFGRAKFICNVPATSNLLAQYAPLYGYQFSDDQSPTIIPEVSFPYGATHINDLQYIFTDYHGDAGIFTPLNKAQEKLSTLMVDYFTNFAKTGNPNQGTLPTWQPYSAEKESLLFLHSDQSKVKMIDNASKRYACDAIL